MESECDLRLQSTKEDLWVTTKKTLPHLNSPASQVIVIMTVIVIELTGFEFMGKLGNCDYNCDRD